MYAVLKAGNNHVTYKSFIPLAISEGTVSMRTIYLDFRADFLWVGTYGTSLSGIQELWLDEMRFLGFELARGWAGKPYESDRTDRRVRKPLYDYKPIPSGTCCDVEIWTRDCGNLSIIILEQKYKVINIKNSLFAYTYK
jgi:hypothetical protein